MDKFAKSFSNKQSIKSNPKIDMTSELDFPELNLEISKTSDVSSNKTMWNNSNNQYEEKQENEENQKNKQNLQISEEDGWCILTQYPTNLKPQTHKTKDEIHQEYIESLTPHEYHELAHQTFTKILDRRHEHDIKFIEIHGYDYFHQQYIMPNRDIFDEDDEDNYSYDIVSSDDEYDI